MCFFSLYSIIIFSLSLFLFSSFFSTIGEYSFIRSLMEKLLQLGAGFKICSKKFQGSVFDNQCCGFDSYSFFFFLTAIALICTISYVLPSNKKKKTIIGHIKAITKSTVLAHPHIYEFKVTNQCTVLCKEQSKSCFSYPPTFQFAASDTILGRHDMHQYDTKNTLTG